MQIQVGAHTVAAADPLHDGLGDVLDRIHGRLGTH
jgi:hypothetical protein